MILVVARRKYVSEANANYHTSTIYLPEYMSDIEKTIVNIANKDTNYIIGFKIDGNKLTLTQVSAALGIVSVYGINL